MLPAASRMRNVPTSGLRKGRKASPESQNGSRPVVHLRKREGKLKGGKKHSQSELYNELLRRGWPVVQEHRFHETRQWRADIAHLGAKVILEYEGGVYTGGRHTRPSGFIGDIEKYQAAKELGWDVVRAALPHSKDGSAIKWFESSLKARGFEPYDRPLTPEDIELLYPPQKPTRRKRSNESRRAIKQVVEGTA